MWTRRQLLFSAAGASLAGSAALAAASSNRRLIIVLASGGWDVSHCFAPSLGDPTVQGPEVDEDPHNPDDHEAVQTFHGIPLVVNEFKRPNVSRFFDSWGDRACVVNGIYTGAIGHATALTRMLTGTSDAAKPDMGAITGRVHGATVPLGHIDVSGDSYFGQLAASSGRLGSRGQIAALLDDQLAFQAPPGSPSAYPQFSPSDADSDAVAAHLRARAQRFALQRSDGGGPNDHRLSAYFESLDRAASFVDNSESLLEVVEPGVQISATTSVDIAVDLLARDICRSVLFNTRDSWDTHVGNVAQHGMYNGLFLELNALMEGLVREDLLSTTTVAVISEMTRTPMQNGRGGKDHWPHATMLLLGASVRGGTVLGGYGPALSSSRVDLNTGVVRPDGDLLLYDRMLAGLLEVLDIDPGDWLPDATPFRGLRA